MAIRWMGVCLDCADARELADSRYSSTLIPRQLVDADERVLAG